MAGNSRVGGGILNIITESLYDKPVVVFREYVQNAVDSLRRTEENDRKVDLCCKIVNDRNNLYFIDNGVGIEQDFFEKKMKSIALSEKKRAVDIGYKGIGRLSGISYSKMIFFINILSYKMGQYQIFTISTEKYNKLKNSAEIADMTFDEVMDNISQLPEELEDKEIENVLEKHKSMFSKTDTGFLVCLKDIASVLRNMTDNGGFIKKELGWLLPVKFMDELYEKSSDGLSSEDAQRAELFSELSEGDEASEVIPAKAFHIYYNGDMIERPIKKDMLSGCLCRCDFGKYAVGFHCFPKGKFYVRKNNEFQGIRLYIDNMLLCDEKEIIAMLLQNNLIKHTTNELLQTVRSVGVMIYITDKINIVANARRTFIEVIDQPSMEFLELLAEFIERVYDARYAMSKWFSQKESVSRNEIELKKAKENAIKKLQLLAEREIQIEFNDEKFEDLSKNEQKIRVKKKIQKLVNEKITAYLLEAPEVNYEHAYDDFVQWLLSNFHVKKKS